MGRSQRRHWWVSSGAIAACGATVIGLDVRVRGADVDAWECSSYVVRMEMVAGTC